MAAIASSISRFVSASDGLRLHMREYGSARDDGLPVVCLAGLTRHAGDFEPLASALAQGILGRKRRVLALDYRGRGLSSHDPDWRHYDLAVENADLLAVLTAVGIDQAIFIGTSRGGLHAMLLAAARPSLLRGVVLNDVGPVLEIQGLLRIRGTLGKLAAPRSFADATDLLKRLMSAQFSALTDADWAFYARQTFVEETGVFRPSFDPKLLRPLAKLDLDSPLPHLWAQFEGLRSAPLLVLRGANSDLLSPATLEEMKRRHPNCETYTVEGQGHAPLLRDDTTIEKIAAFIAKLDPA